MNCAQCSHVYTHVKVYFSYVCVYEFLCMYFDVCVCLRLHVLLICLCVHACSQVICLSVKGHGVQVHVDV